MKKPKMKPAVVIAAGTVKKAPSGSEDKQIKKIAGGKMTDRGMKRGGK